MKTHLRKPSGGALCNQQPRVYGPLRLAGASKVVSDSITTQGESK
jgi:hypothetical protein